MEETKAKYLEFFNKSIMTHLFCAIISFIVTFLLTIFGPDGTATRISILIALSLTFTHAAKTGYALANAEILKKL